VAFFSRRFGPKTPNLRHISKKGPLLIEVHVVGESVDEITLVKYSRIFAFSVTMGNFRDKGDSRLVLYSDGMMRFTEASMAASIMIFSVKRAGFGTALQGVSSVPAGVSVFIPYDCILSPESRYKVVLVG
jgi:hypothetical protein